jgi:hypothetical protein
MSRVTTTRPSTTDCYQLDRQRELALEALLSGATHAEAGTACGRHRVTITRWANYDPNFIAEWNRRRMELAKSTAERLRSTAVRAAEAVAAAIEAEAREGRAVIALKLLALIGVNNLLDVDPIGPVTAEAVLGAAATKRGTQELLQAAQEALYADEVAAEWETELGRPEPPTSEQADRDNRLQ